MTPAKISKFFEILKTENPNPQTELKYNNNFQLLCAVLLSAQSTDAGVNKATPALFAAAPDAYKMHALGINGIEEYIKTIGLYHSKAKHLYQTCGILIKEYKGEIPKGRKELEALPGVGRKTANVVLNVAYGEPTMAVDTHIFRVSNRTGLAAGSTPLAVEKGLLKNIPAKYMQHAHHWLILLGRYTCTARAPKCGQCKVYKYCGYEEKQQIQK